MHSRHIATARRLAVEYTSHHTRTLWFPVIGGVCAAIIAWLLGITVTFFPWLSEGLVRGALDVAVCVVIAYILFFAGVFIWFLVRRWAMANLNLYLVISAIGIVIALGGLGGYFLIPERGPVEWEFQKTGYAIRLEWVLEQRGSPLKFYVPGFIFPGKNGPIPLYQIEASITIDRNKKEIPLFIVADNQWARFSDIVNIPANMQFQLGCQMRSDTLHCDGFPERLTVDQFLADIGGFTFSFGHDGEPPHKWHFSSADLRKQFEKQMPEFEEAIRNNPRLQPPIPRRDNSN